MRFLTFTPRADPGAAASVGVLHGEVVHPVAGVTRLVDLLGDVRRLRAAGQAALDAATGTLPLAEVRVAAPLPVPPSMRDFMTFEQHVAGTQLLNGPDARPPKIFYRQPLFYFSNPAAIIGPEDDVPVAPGSKSFDFELEVAAVIGRPGSNLTVEQAAEHIAGYTILVDWSARDLQFREMQGNLGPAKGKDTATTLGPYLVTADELADRAGVVSFDLAMEVELNGARFGRDSLDNMMWSFGQMVAYASRGTTLQPGDVFGTGTCGMGCLAESWGRQDPELPRAGLAVGDEVTFRVERLGEFTQRVVAAAPVHDIGPPHPRSTEQD